MRPEWYLKKIPRKRNKNWTIKEENYIYTHRIVNKDKTPSEVAYNLKVSLNKIYNKTRMLRKTKRNLCYRCGRKLTVKDKKISKSKNIHFLCQRCRRIIQKYKEDYKQEMIKRHLCITCGNKTGKRPLKGHLQCKTCLSSSHRRRLAEGLCGSCGLHPISYRSKALCNVCLRKNREINRIRREIQA